MEPSETTIQTIPEASSEPGIVEKTVCPKDNSNCRQNKNNFARQKKKWKIKNQAR